MTVFLLADTAWSLSLRCRPDEVTHYLTTRRRQRFNAVAFVPFSPDRDQPGKPADIVGTLAFELTDGKRLTVNTDGSWTCNTGPILFSDFMMGETYDARRERAGWDLPELGSSRREEAQTSKSEIRNPKSEIEPSLLTSAATGFDWLATREVAAPSVPLVAQRSEPVRVVEQLTPLSVNEIKPGVFIFDLGQNIAGWARIRVKASAGTHVTIRHGERRSSSWPTMPLKASRLRPFFDSR